MEVCNEAKRVMVQALSKIYSSRNQRGGIPLHRSLLLTLVMRAARDAYYSARVPAPNPGPDTSGQNGGPVSASRLTPTPELMDSADAPEPPRALPSGDGTFQQVSTADKENCNTTSHPAQSRKRRGKSGAEPDFLPCKKARLDQAEPRRVLHESTARRNYGHCGRDAEALPPTLIPRTVVTC